MVSIENPVEIWVENLVLMQKISLSMIMRKNLACTPLDPHLMLQHQQPIQIICLCQQINFVTEIEKSIGKNKSLFEIYTSFNKQIKILTTEAFDSSQNLFLLKVRSLIIDIIYQRDVLKSLIEYSPQCDSDWMWQTQLRYYITDSSCMLKMSDTKASYSFEYQGNQQKLVQTPLTDKCFLNLAQSSHLGFCGNLFGPAGTGKTETVKALGAALGRQVLVFNCDDSLDFAGIGRIFIGIVSTGAWGCFDEFNRLRQDQLSVIARTFISDRSLSYQYILIITHKFLSPICSRANTIDSKCN